MCKYCIITMDCTSRISYVHTLQYNYYYYILQQISTIDLHRQLPGKVVDQMTTCV